LKKSLLTDSFKRLLPFYLLLTVIVLAVSKNPFFWDKDVLNSKQAYWLLENHFRLIFPSNLDAGYIPAFSYLLALCWKVFGKSLFVAHLLMLPFALLTVYQLKRLLNYFFSDINAIFLTILLVVIDTTFLSQVIVYSTDLPVLFFFLWAVNSIFSKNNRTLTLAILGLCLSHFRGIPLSGMLWIYAVYYNSGKGKINFGNILSVTLSFIPAALMVIAYYVYHYYQTGWFLKHDNSPWRGCYEPVNFKGFLRNIVIFVWRLVDFGKLFFWLPMVFFIGSFRRRFSEDKKFRDLSILLIMSILATAPGMLFYKVLASHRYLIPVYTLAICLSMYLVFHSNLKQKTIRIIYAVVFIGILSGYFWIYPDNIAKGWDATVAHLPFHSLKMKMVEYMEENNIEFDEVGSGIPNTYELKYTNLVKDERKFHQRNFSKDKYIFYTNIINDFSDEELYVLKNKWIPVKEYKYLQVKVILYKNPFYAH
jgi:hypothetical protein